MHDYPLETYSLHLVFQNYYFGERWNFSWMFKNIFQETLLVLLHTVARVNLEEIIKEGFHIYLKKIHKINSIGKSGLHQWLKEVFLVLCVCNEGPVYGIEFSWSVVVIGRDYPFMIDLSPSNSGEVTLEGHKSMDNFETTSPPLFFQRVIFNILVSDRSIRYIYVQKRHIYDIFWHRILFAGNKAGEFKHKVRCIP